MRRDPKVPAGTVHRTVLDSVLLRGNPLGDPTSRRIDVYVPADHSGRDLPLLVYLAAYTSSGLAQTNWKNFEETLPDRLDRLIHSGSMPPAVVAFPDCFTRLGGNQYIDSPAIGPWSRVLTQEMLPFVEERFGCGGPGRRGVLGKSSGGYGALVQAMLNPEVWTAAACHSGDMGFDLCCLADMPTALRTLSRFEFSVDRFIAAFESAQRVNGDDIHTLMLLCMAASYDPDTEAPWGIRLPVDTQTCEVIEARWANWRRWDPVRMVEHHAAALRQCRMLFIDCGDADQYDLLYGARRLHRELQVLDIPHRYEEFSGTHSGIDHRLDTSLPLLARVLSTRD